jgi:long-chain acyl-CoA synthetase
MTHETGPEPAFRSIPDLIRQQAESRPRHPALICNGRSMDYGTLDLLMDRVAASLQRDEARQGDAVAICASSRLEYAAVFLGALRAGLAVAPLAPSSSPESFARMVADCGARTLFVDASVEGLLAPAALPPEIRRVSLDGSDVGMAMEAWLATSDIEPQPVVIDPADAFNIIYSSGTTGTPKGIVQSHGMRWAHVHRAAALGYDRDAVTLCSTPLYSNTTLVSFFPTVAGGGTVILMPKFDAQGFLSLAQQHRVTHAMLVPVQYQRLMDLPEFDRYDLSSFRMKLCTSAPFSAALKAQVIKRWPGALVEIYGSTEGGGTCMLFANQHPDKLHTVGRPAPGHDIRLIDDEGREVAQGGVGEVVGRSPAMMNGYHNQGDKTAEVFWFDQNGQRYIRSGDIGRFDADGFLTLVDRKKDMIISGGFNVYPSDIEAVLLQNEAIKDASVVGVPSRQWGETPVAVVVLESGRAETAEQIRDWANARLGKTQRLSAVRLIEALPRNAIGKVLKRRGIGSLDGSGLGVGLLLPRAERALDVFAARLLEHA